MRNLLPLFGLAFVVLVIFGVIAGGIIMIGIGINDEINKDEAAQKGKEASPKGATSAQPQPGKDMPTKETRNLVEARTGFVTKQVPTDYVPSGLDLQAIPQVKNVKYTSPAGNLSAYVSNHPFPMINRPAVVWVHDGFGGITPDDWAKAKPFHDSGCVVIVPSFRAENTNNAGKFEMFYGEVDDLISAIGFAGKQPGVDPNRVYVVGHGTGGTLALLAAATGTRNVRAFFTIGGTPDLEELFSKPGADPFDDAAPPFDPKAPNETRLRSSLPFVGSMHQPIFYFGASAVDSDGCNQATRMETTARQMGKPLRVFIVPRATRQNFVVPIVNLVRQKIDRDIGPVPIIRIEYPEVSQPFNK